MEPNLEAGLYRAVGSAFDDPQPSFVTRSTDNPLLVALGRAVVAGSSGCFEEAFDRLWEGLEELESGGEEGALEALRVEYARLFYGPPVPLVGLCEHDHRVGLDAAANAAELVRLYGGAGLAAARDFHDWPDHVSLELEFMAGLLDRGRPAEAERFRAAHLAGFVPRFATEVRRHTRSTFYDAAAFALAELCARERRSGPGATHEKDQEVST